jgi:hypothetical protein
MSKLGDQGLLKSIKMMALPRGQGSRSLLEDEKQNHEQQRQPFSPFMSDALARVDGGVINFMHVSRYEWRYTQSEEATWEPRKRPVLMRGRSGWWWGEDEESKAESRDLIAIIGADDSVHWVYESG